MQQWEYCQLHVYEDPDWKVRYYGSSGKIVRNVGQMSDVAMARLGTAGWELVGITVFADSRGGGTNLYFKRPIQAGRAIDDAL